MGCPVLRFTCRLQPDDSPKDMPAPNPANFKIINAEQVGSALVVEVNYPDCTNYEGNKILVFECMQMRELEWKETLDPHFHKYGGPVARFEPTRKGRKLAVKLAEIMR